MHVKIILISSNVSLSQKVEILKLDLTSCFQVAIMVIKVLFILAIILSFLFYSLFALNSYKFGGRSYPTKNHISVFFFFFSISFGINFRCFINFLMMAYSQVKNVRGFYKSVPYIFKN